MNIIELSILMAKMPCKLDMTYCVFVVRDLRCSYRTESPLSSLNLTVRNLDLI